MDNSDKPINHGINLSFILRDTNGDVEAAQRRINRIINKLQDENEELRKRLGIAE